MKKMYKFSTLLLSVLTLGFMLTSCSSARKMAKKAPAGETPVQVYCSGPQYQSDTQAFRANAIGESMDQAISQKIALNNARTNLASEMTVTLKGLLNNYAKQQVHNTDEELEKNFQDLSQEVVDQQLVGTRTICEKVTKSDKGNYKTYIAIELANDKVLSSLSNRLSQDTKLKIDYDYTKFKKEFEQAIQNQENNK
ncbi:MAG: hypothetical protein IH595_04310 [Bacteroidales bacterium]|nr:hypothetical protein [Bacteroidales bacterium]